MTDTTHAPAHDLSEFYHRAIIRIPSRTIIDNQQWVPITLPNTTTIEFYNDDFTGENDISIFIKNVRLPKLQHLVIRLHRISVDDEALNIMKEMNLTSLTKYSGHVSFLNEYGHHFNFQEIDTRWAGSDPLTDAALARVLRTPNLRVLKVSLHSSQHAVLQQEVSESLQLLVILVGESQHMTTTLRTFYPAALSQRNLLVLEVFINARHPPANGIQHEVFNAILAHPTLRYVQLDFDGVIPPEYVARFETKNTVIRRRGTRRYVTNRSITIVRRVVFLKCTGAAIRALHGRPVASAPGSGAMLTLPQKDGDHAVVSRIASMLGTGFHDLDLDAEDYILYWE